MKAENIEKVVVSLNDKVITAFGEMVQAHFEHKDPQEIEKLLEKVVDLDVRRSLAMRILASTLLKKSQRP